MAERQVLRFGPGVSSGSSSVDLGPLAQHIKPTVTNLWVKMDSDRQINPVFKSAETTGHG